MHSGVEPSGLLSMSKSTLYVSCRILSMARLRLVSDSLALPGWCNDNVTTTNSYIERRVDVASVVACSVVILGDRVKLRRRKSARTGHKQ